MTDSRYSLRSLRPSGATNGQAMVMLPSGLWGPGNVVRSVASADGTVTVDDTDPLHLDLSVASGAGTEGTLLLDWTATPVASVPPTTPVNTIVFMKSTALPTQHWDFRGLSALPAGWARRGVASETFDAAGMTATYTSGQDHYYTLSSLAPAGTLEAKMVSGPSSMFGPQIYASATTKGATTAWYTAPNGALLLSLGSAHNYDSVAFANAGGAAGTYPVWFRVRYAANVAYGSFSTNGTTWSAEVNIARTMGGVDEIAIGSASGSASAKWEYVTWTPTGTVSGGLLGWWDGSTIVSF